MAWDDQMKRVAVKAIGQVESSMNYVSINYNDPITVGIAQWFGVRAAAILNKMRSKYPTQYSQVAQSLRTRLESVAETSTSWNTYYLSREEGNSLGPLLRIASDIQDSQLVADLEAYVGTAKQYGLDHQTNTEAFILWCVAYHQGPRYALQVLNNVGGSASLDGMLRGILANGVLGQYTNRYNGAYNIIKNRDTAGVGSGLGKINTTPGNGSGASDSGQISISGGNLRIFADDSMGLVVKTPWGNVRAEMLGHNVWGAKLDDITRTINNTIQQEAAKRNQSQAGAGGGGAVAPGDGSVGAKALAWIMARRGKFAYLQGPGRMDPDNSGVTDCSGLMYAAFKATSGTFVGTWTGDQYFRGAEPFPRRGGAMTAEERAQLRPGDMIVMAWKSTGSYYPETDHVDMVVDSNTLVGHGGNPYYGPVTYSIDRLAATRWWTVRRHG